MIQSLFDPQFESKACMGLLRVAMRYVALTVTGLTVTIGCSKKVEPVAVMVAESSPVSVSIISERRINDTLELITEITPTVVWPSDDVAIEVTALKDGEQVARVEVSPRASLARVRASSPAAEATSDVLLRPGTPVVVPISLTAPEMTDYRLDVKWGGYSRDSGAAKSLNAGDLTRPSDSGVANREPAIQTADTIPSVPDGTVLKREGGATIATSQGALLLADTTLSVVEQSCPTKPCPVEYLYSAVLQNRTDAVVSSVALAAEFRAQSGEVGDASEIQLDDIQLAPGEERPLKVTFEGPDSSGGSLSVTPRLRIVSFK